MWGGTIERYTYAIANRLQTDIFFATTHVRLASLRKADFAITGSAGGFNCLCAFGRGSSGYYGSVG